MEDNKKDKYEEIEQRYKTLQQQGSYSIFGPFRNYFYDFWWQFQKNNDDLIFRKWNSQFFQEHT